MTWSKFGKIILATLIIGTAIIAVLMFAVALLYVTIWLVVTGWGILIIVAVGFYIWIGYRVHSLVNDAEKNKVSIWREFWGGR